LAICFSRGIIQIPQPGRETPAGSETGEDHAHQVVITKYQLRNAPIVRDPSRIPQSRWEAPKPGRNKRIPEETMRPESMTPASCHIGYFQKGNRPSSQGRHRVQSRWSGLQPLLAREGRNLE
jgi:hypothetical protein